MLALRNGHGGAFRPVLSFAAVSEVLAVGDVRPIEVPEMPVHAQGAPARVVFADDDEQLRELLRTLLQLLPHVTVVGEASDGIEAVQMVARHYPDTVLLDVNMPRLDGFAAAEVIRSFRPETRLLLHTGEPDDEKRRRAALLQLPLLDKLHIPATMDLVEDAAIAGKHSLSTDIEPLVLLALAGRANEGVIVVRADETIPYYNPTVASVLDLPFPPERVTLADLRKRQLVALRANGSPYPLEEQPLARALADRKAVSDVVYLRDKNRKVRPYTMLSRPFFAPDGDLIGVANYIAPAGDTDAFDSIEEDMEQGAL
jgi:CheY-like chemotaxis protein